MAVASLILGIFSIFAAIGGVGTVMVPYLGSFLSFLAPLVALAGVILGGVGLSQANRSGEATGLAMAGLIVSGVAFLPALLLALTCGMCNAACSNNAARTGGGVFSIFDGGVPPRMPIPAPAPAPSQPPGPSPIPAPVPAVGGDAEPAVAPPPAFPPPPIERPNAEEELELPPDPVTS